MRLECEFINGVFTKEEFSAALDTSIANQYNLAYDLYDRDYRPKMALFVSKYDHCLYDILARHQSKELAVDIPFILSNHNDLKSIADRFDIPFIMFLLLKKRKKKLRRNNLKY